MRTSKETNNSSAELIAIIKEMLEQEPDLESLLGLPFVEGDNQSIEKQFVNWRTDFSGGQTSRWHQLWTLRSVLISSRGLAKDCIIFLCA